MGCPPGARDVTQRLSVCWKPLPVGCRGPGGCLGLGCLNPQNTVPSMFVDTTVLGTAGGNHHRPEGPGTPPRRDSWAGFSGANYRRGGVWGASRRWGATASVPRSGVDTHSVGTVFLRVKKGAQHRKTPAENSHRAEVRRGLSHSISTGENSADFFPPALEGHPSWHAGQSGYKGPHHGSWSAGHPSRHAGQSGLRRPRHARQSG